MAVTKISTEVFLETAPNALVLDVRSPAEFAHAAYPGALSLPLFSDAERKEVGTAYKQVSRQAAIKIGLTYFGSKLLPMVQMVEAAMGEQQKQVLVHCWRGGMRSAAVAWLLDLYGFRVSTLIGGYKSFRAWCLAQLQINYPLHVLGGFTGSGKTHTLLAMQKSGANIVDLEGLAHHRGSAFGNLGQPAQPSQEQFENLLALQLHQLGQATPIWVEDESQRIGSVNIPPTFFAQMRQAKVHFLDIAVEQRLDCIVADYGDFEKGKLADTIARIQKKMGGLETKTALEHLEQGNLRECFRILLFYYDKLYAKGLAKRDNSAALLSTIVCERVDPITNSKKILSQ
jgi:tRNA 2-selenouridine synthase